MDSIPFWAKTSAFNKHAVVLIHLSKQGSKAVMLWSSGESKEILFCGTVRIALNVCYAMHTKLTLPLHDWKAN